MEQGVGEARGVLLCQLRRDLAAAEDALLHRAGQEEEDRAAEQLRHQEAPLDTAELARALEGGARSSGQAVAGIDAGAPADLVVLLDDDPMLAGHDDRSRLDALVFSGYPLPVEKVMVDGEWRVVDAEHVDRVRARAEFIATLEKLGASS